MPRRVLLNACLPKKIERELADHVVAMVQEMGWSGKKNGALMQLARSAFDVFITGGQNLRHSKILPMQM